MASALALARSLDLIMLAEAAARTLTIPRPGSFKTAQNVAMTFINPRPTDLTPPEISAVSRAPVHLRALVHAATESRSLLLIQYTDFTHAEASAKARA